MNLILWWNRWKCQNACQICQSICAGWAYSSGFVNEEMISNHLPPPGDDTLVLLCGPPAMINSACLPNLEKLGYDKSRIFAY